ncbi:hypothetical protein ACS0TY_013256 [Phlomoides rotata]
MIAIVRKNLACLCSRHKSSVSPPLSPHFFSTWRERQSVNCPRVYDLLLHKHNFSAELASKVASDLDLHKIPENADSVLSFLKEIGCSSTQLEKIVKCKPRILFHNVEDIKLKIKIFQDLGLSPADVAKMISNHPMILHLTAQSKILPSLSVLKVLLGSDNEVARLLRRCARCISADLENNLVPNVEFLKSIGVPMERILFFLYSYPRVLLVKPNVMKKSAERAKEMGFDESSKMFVHALRIIAPMSKGMWEVKLQSFQDMGFSVSDTLTMFKDFPAVFNISMKKMEKGKQLLLATGKFNMSSIVDFPASLGYSIEQRLVPRLRILGILESKNLIKRPSLPTMCTLSDDKFFERFVRPHSTEVGEEFVPKRRVKDKNYIKP